MLEYVGILLLVDLNPTPFVGILIVRFHGEMRAPSLLHELHYVTIAKFVISFDFSCFKEHCDISKVMVVLDNVVEKGVSSTANVW